MGPPQPPRAPHTAGTHRHQTRAVGAATAAAFSATAAAAAAVLLLLGVCGVVPSEAALISANDLAALMEIKPQWTPYLNLSTWDAANDCSKWQYITCSLDRVTRFDITNGKIASPFPTVISNLTRLSQIYADGNSFTGSLPDEMSRLSNLALVRLSNSNIGGKLPASMGSLPNLVIMYIVNNEFVDTIPSTWSALKIREMNMAGNKFSGPFPTIVCAWTGLLTLRMGGQPWTGTIPGCLSRLTRLTHLYLDQTWNMNGTIPAEIGSMSSLQNLFLWGNNLTGSIPLSIGNLQDLRIIFLSSNSLTGPLPYTMGKLKKLTDWVMEFNKIDGFIPPTIGGMTSCSRILLDNNELSGSIPASIGKLSNLKWLLLEGNNLVGSIPASLSRMPNLININLEDNKFVGRVPSAFVSPFVKQVNVRSNYFSGTPTYTFANGTGFCAPTRSEGSFFFLSSSKNNCFKGASGNNCGIKDYPDPDTQKGGATCPNFCGADNMVGACGGNGYCDTTLAGTPRCVCNTGYLPSDNGLTCLPIAVM